MENIDVFLLIGQSNARGVGDKTYSEIPNENCFEYLSNNEIIKMRCELEKSECDIDKMFVSLTGYWLGHKDYFTRTRKIAAAQFIACKECDILSLGSNRAMTFHDENLTIDDVHYSQIGLNILGRDLSDNILKYNDTKKDIVLKDTIDLHKYREYIYKLEKLQNDYI